MTPRQAFAWLLSLATVFCFVGTIANIMRGEWIDSAYFAVYMVVFIIMNFLFG